MAKIKIEVNRLAKYNVGIQMRIIRKALEYFNVPCDRKYIEGILSLLGPRKTGKRLDLCGIVARRDYDKLLLERKEYSIAVGSKRSINKNSGKILHIGKKIRLPGAIISSKILTPETIEEKEIKNISRDIVYFDLDYITQPLKIRYRCSGDIFTPFGLEGKKKLKKILIDDKISSYKRDLIPLIVDSKNNILWIAGHKRSNIAPLSNKTEKVLQIKITKIDDNK